MEINQIVKATVGTFAILGFRDIDGVPSAQVKPVHPVTHKPGRGEMAFPLSILSPVS